MKIGIAADMTDRGNSHVSLSAEMKKLMKYASVIIPPMIIAASDRLLCKRFFPKRTTAMLFS